MKQIIFHRIIYIYTQMLAGHYLLWLCMCFHHHRSGLTRKNYNSKTRDSIPTAGQWWRKHRNISYPTGPRPRNTTIVKKIYRDSELIWSHYLYIYIYISLFVIQGRVVPIATAESTTLSVTLIIIILSIIFLQIHQTFSLITTFNQLWVAA